MSQLKSTLGHLLHPLSRSNSRRGDKDKDTDKDTDVNADPLEADSPGTPSQPRGKIGFPNLCRSKTASSCELFGILKALAAGGNDVDVGLEMDDTDVTDLEQAESASPVPRASISSETTLRPDVAALEEPLEVQDEEKQKEKLEKQMNDAIATVRERDMLSSRFTALSLSNMSSLSQGYSQKKQAKKRPELPRSSSFQPDAEHDTADLIEPAAEAGPVETPIPESPVEGESDADGYTDTAQTSVAEESTTLGADDVPDEVKIAAIIEEFGDIAGLIQPPPGQAEAEPERMLAEAKGSLFKGVMMIGNLHLTTHRLLFHAQIPPESAMIAFTNKSGDTVPGENAPRAPDVLMAGPVTMHRHGPLLARRRLWMEISTEMITTYPTGDEAGRVRPLQTVLLSSVQRMVPYENESPTDFHITYDTLNGSREMYFTVDTEQSGLQWRRSLEAALYRHARRRWLVNMAQHAERVDAEADGLDDWSTMRCCLPLDRVNINGISEYHGFATLIGFDIGLDRDKTQWPVEKLAQGDFSGRMDLADAKSKRKSLVPGLQFMRSKPGEQKDHKDPRESSLLQRKSSQAKKSDGRDSPLVTPSSPSLPPTPTKPGVSTPRRENTQYLDTILPPPLAAAGQDSCGLPTWCASTRVNVSVLNEQAWFAEALQSAVAAAHERQFKPDVTRPKMVLDVAGYDCLATDEDLEAQLGKKASRPSTSSDDAEAEDDLDEEQDHDHGPKSLTRAVRKAEKASMAAKVFGLREDEGVYLKRCYIAQGLVPVRGHIILTRQYICFWRRATVGDDIKYRFSCADVKGADACPSVRTGFHGMALKVHGQHDLKFEFWSKSSRDDVIARVQAICSARDSEAESSGLGSTPTTPVDPYGPRVDSPTPLSTAAASTPVFKHAADILVPPKDTVFASRTFPDEALSHMPFVANKPFQAVSRLTPRHFVCLTIGSRGDVQPYIALGLRLKQDGHRVTIVTHSEFKEWIESYDIGHRQAGGDPTALMKLSSDHKMFSPGFFKESLGSFRQWLDDLLRDSWYACHDADVLIESPSTMSGIHIAEALKIPYFRAFTMPWTRTSAYPQAFMVPAFEMGPSFNYSTYVLYDSIIWRATAGQINRWRKRYLRIPSTDLDKLAITKVPFLYNFSPSVVPKPLDWNDDITITGYWNLENSDADWSPPDSLVQFMDKAKEDGKPLVYIGFGSIVVPRPNAMTRSIIAAVEKADVRAIIAKGWSSRGSNPADEGGEIEFPENCYGVEKVPHGWLFPRINAAMHHGGAGTVGASLRAGIPTLIKPWFGDQFFWAIRVAKLEVGLKVASLRADDIAHALVKATTDKVMLEKAARIGARIRAENGVENALQAIHFNIGRAASDRTKM